MEKDRYRRLPRKYIPDKISPDQPVVFGSEHLHYLINVMRMKTGHKIRLFNGCEGEWLCRLEKAGSKTVRGIPEEQLKLQTWPERKIHLLFCPIKKQRMDFLVEKSVELGVTDFHPVITENTEVRKINRTRLRKQIIEASEQCERLDIPVINEISRMSEILGSWRETEKIITCMERIDAENTGKIDPKGNTPIAIFVGPEGGFTEKEREYISSSPLCMAVSLGKNILRSETAALAAISQKI
jgi:16S rRNA (uracil1498-N3)-methyltransferase